MIGISLVCGILSTCISSGLIIFVVIGTWLFGVSFRIGVIGFCNVSVLGSICVFSFGPVIKLSIPVLLFLILYFGIPITPRL